MPEERYISMEEAAKQLKVTRTALYYYIRILKLEKKKFELDKRVYLKMPDFERIKKLREEAARRTTEEGVTQPLLCDGEIRHKTKHLVAEVVSRPLVTA